MTKFLSRSATAPASTSTAVAVPAALPVPVRVSSLSAAVPLALCLALAACAGTRGGEAVATAALQPTLGNTASGTAVLRQRGDHVVLHARFAGLTPGAHGFHIHERGDCSAPDGSSAGAHFNPGGAAHGDPAGSAHHAGDLPMLIANNAGNATLEYAISGASLEGGATSLVGRALIVHAAPDDYRSQPAGNSGARVACGVIVAN